MLTRHTDAGCQRFTGLLGRDGRAGPRGQPQQGQPAEGTPPTAHENESDHRKGGDGQEDNGSVHHQGVDGQAGDRVERTRVGDQCKDT